MVALHGHAPSHAEEGATGLLHEVGKVSFRRNDGWGGPAASVGCSVAQIAKSIIFRSGETPILVVASGINRIDRIKDGAALGRKVERADPAWVEATTGFAVGGVAPVGHLAPALILIDEDLLALDPVWAAAGSPTHAFRTTPADLVRVTGGSVANVKA